MQHGHCGCEVVRNAVGVQSHCPRAKIEATASDGAENASDHFVTSFLVLGHRKGGVFVETPPQSVKKVEVQEALPPAGVIGAEPLTLVPQHFPRKPA